MQTGKTAIRGDIQALRGWAVLLVVVYHAWPKQVRAGYLGVDIFFVISGYLITQLIAKGIDRGTFSFREFYTRRFRRLLPAAYVTFLLTTLASVWLLNYTELPDYRNQLLGALTFTANIALWRQTGYFEGAAEQKPLLHIWSLSIEEQYYMLLPATLVFIPRRFWKPGAVAVLLGSFSLWYYMSLTHPSAGFYWLPSRAWEMALGSIGALMFQSQRLRECARVAFWPLLIVLLLVPIGLRTEALRGFDRALACVATLVVILRDNAALASFPPVKALAALGDISYSVYLVHWPIVSLFRSSWMGEAPPLFPYAYLLLSLGGGWLLYRAVEDPVRKSTLSLTPRVVVATVLCSAFLLGISVVAMRTRQSEALWAQRLRINYGLSIACDFSDSPYTPLTQCRTSDAADTLLWGDSLVMQLVPGLAEVGIGEGLVQATRSSCAPFQDLAVVSRDNDGRYTPERATECTSFNRAILDTAVRDRSIRTVILSGMFHAYVQDDTELNVSHGGRVSPPDLSIAVEAMKKTVLSLRANGKKVIVVSAFPGNGKDYSRCLERSIQRTPAWGPDAGCVISRESFDRYNATTMEFLRRLEREVPVKVIHMEDFLCDTKQCATTVNGVPLYRDKSHITYEASVLLARKFNLPKLLLEGAY